LASEKKDAGQLKKQDTELVSINETADDVPHSASGRSAGLSLSGKWNISTPSNHHAERDSKLGFEKLEKPDLVIQGDIYSLAYAALVDHDVMLPD
jgi:hypothetical protein